MARLSEMSGEPLEQMRDHIGRLERYAWAVQIIAQQYRERCTDCTRATLNEYPQTLADELQFAMRKLQNCMFEADVKFDPPARVQDEAEIGAEEVDLWADMTVADPHGKAE